MANFPVQRAGEAPYQPDLPHWPPHHQTPSTPAAEILKGTVLVVVFAGGLLALVDVL